MEESILTSIKKLLGISEDYTHFDTDIIMHINSVFFTLSQLGIGPEDGFYIQDKSDVWSDYISDGPLLNTIKIYIFYKVKLAFDPPTSSFVLEAFNQSIREIEWRMNFEIEKEATNNE